MSPGTSAAESAAAHEAQQVAGCPARRQESVAGTRGIRSGEPRAAHRRCSRNVADVNLAQRLRGRCHHTRSLPTALLGLSLPPSRHLKCCRLLERITRWRRAPRKSFSDRSAAYGSARGAQGWGRCKAAQPETGQRTAGRAENLRYHLRLLLKRLTTLPSFRGPSTRQSSTKTSGEVTINLPQYISGPHGCTKGLSGEERSMLWK